MSDIIINLLEELEESTSDEIDVWFKNNWI